MMAPLSLSGLLFVSAIILSAADLCVVTSAPLPRPHQTAQQQLSRYTVSSRTASKMAPVETLRAGSTTKDGAVDKKSNSIRSTTVKNLLGVWSVLQVLSILFNAVKRLVPIALEPILKKELEPYQAVVCVVWCIYMAYTEGYQAFQRKFSPLVVKRAFGLSKNPSILKCLLAGPYSMGLFGATKNRMMVSWGVTIGVFAIVKAVKKLPYPWRSIVDAGVVVGLTYGALSMCLQTVRALFGWSPDCDECLDDKKDEKKV